LRNKNKGKGKLIGEPMEIQIFNFAEGEICDVDAEDK
jgi:hypothetical protein